MVRSSGQDLILLFSRKNCPLRWYIYTEIEYMCVCVFVYKK